MLTYTIEIQKQKNLLTSTMLSQVAKLNSAYIFSLKGSDTPPQVLVLHLVSLIPLVTANNEYSHICYNLYQTIHLDFLNNNHGE